MLFWCELYSGVTSDYVVHAGKQESVWLVYLAFLLFLKLYASLK